MRRVVISGPGVVPPVGVGKDACWLNWLNGVPGAMPLDRVTCCNLFGQHAFGAPLVYAASDFDPGTHHVPPTYPSAAAAHRTFHDASGDKGAWDATCAGIALATAACGTQTLTLRFTRATNRGQEVFHSDHNPAK